MALVTMDTTVLQTELNALNAAIVTYTATGVLPVSFSIPTGHSLDAKDTLRILQERRAFLMSFINSFDVPYLTSVSG